MPEVIIPYSPTPDREHTFMRVTSFLNHHDWEVVSGTSMPYNKGRSVYDLALASQSDILVIHDADVICQPGGIRKAVQAVREGAAWAVPHGLVYRLSEAACKTRMCLPCVWKDIDQLLVPKCERPPYQGFWGGGVTVIPRQNYLDCPIDPRFEGWGQEDEAWGEALQTLYGPGWRGNAALVHFWHEPQPRATQRWGSEASRMLFQTEYHCWNGNSMEMRATIERAKTALVMSGKSND